MSDEAWRWISAEEAARLHGLGVACGEWTRRWPDQVGRMGEQIESVSALPRPDVDDAYSALAIYERFPAWLDGVRTGAGAGFEDRVVMDALRWLAHDLLMEVHDYRRREALERQRKQQALERRRRTIAQRRAAS